MQINDLVYGNFEIKEPVIIELLNTPEFKRLKKISMGGYYPAYYELQPINNNRYNHSVGVFLLLRKYNAGLEEQIAGLLHDVSHSAFSHAIDYIDDNPEAHKTQKNQDDYHEEFIRNSDIPSILKKHHFNLDNILDDKDFSLKENELPDICADRLDYTLREGFVVTKSINEAARDKILSGLINHNHQFAFNNIESARVFADLFWQLNETNWCGRRTAIMFAFNGLLLRYSINQGYITKLDLFKMTDDEVIERLRKTNDTKLLHIFNILNLKQEQIDNELLAGISQVVCKNRKVDPYVFGNNRLIRLSEVDLEFAAKIKDTPEYKTYFS